MNYYLKKKKIKTFVQEIEMRIICKRKKKLRRRLYTQN